MTLATLRSLLAGHRIAVALWLALLLPLGQSAAAAHLLSHIGAHPAFALGLDGGAAFDEGHCDQCLAATAVGTAAPPPPILDAGGPAAREVQPPSTTDTRVDTADRLGYRSRAPPSSPR